ncbi:hypothetical protein [Comamonas sp. NoAH]|uniref:hypothetical protein n=1 Tax=Comamonas halotolerans TaxID=3041496 RepID=UPI0024E18B1E|nr:hypothetical protein [Comamonas sp. NoAH]
MPKSPPQSINPETQIDTTRRQTPGDPGASGKLPHERDQSVNMTDQTPSPDMQQAHRDLKKGLVDTDARGTDGKPLGDDVPTA